MITFTYDTANTLEYIQKSLGEISNKSRVVLARATNETAKKAKVLLAEKARETYEVKKGGFTKAIKMKSASPSNPCAILRVTGRPIELKQFKVSPASYKPEKRPVMTKARAVKVNSMKPLEKNGIKAFIVKYKNGHVSVATRDSSSRYPIRSLYSASIPSMIGSRRYVYGILEPKLQDILRQQVDRQINRVLAGR